MFQVFFRAGVLGEMEELRDDKIGQIMIWLQAKVRAYNALKKYKALKDQRDALEIVQRSLRRFMRLRTWPWWHLWKLIRPTLKCTNIQEEIKVI